METFDKFTQCQVSRFVSFAQQLPSENEERKTRVHIFVFTLFVVVVVVTVVIVVVVVVVVHLHLLLLLLAVTGYSSRKDILVIKNEVNLYVSIKYN